MILVYVAVGGAIGSGGRYLLTGLVNRGAAPHSPWGTFVVNILGCFVFGVIAAMAERRAPLPPAGRAFLLAGVLGGFTTFSSYTFETFMLLRAGQAARAVVNAGAQVVLGLGALWAGYAVGRQL